MKKILNEKEFLNQISKLDNAVDRFLMAGIFYGLQGETVAGEQVLKIKKTDVDFSNGTIKLLDGRIVAMNDSLEKITTDAINQTIYVKLGGVGKTSEDYNFNPSSEYVVRVKPTKTNDNGLNTLSKEGFKTRMKSINTFLGTDYSISTLKASGAYNILKKENKKWSVREAESFLKENGLGIRRATVSEIIKELNGGK